MTIDMYGEKVASACELIRQVSGKEYFDAFGVSCEGILELFIDCMDQVRQIERESLMQLFLDPENQPTQYGTMLVSAAPIAASKEQSNG